MVDRLKVVHVVGARPNFMKIAPVIRALDGSSGFDVDQTLVHTGQHYDDDMSLIFFRELELPAPNVDLGVGSGTHAVQTAAVIKALEPVLIDKRPDWVVVVGDVNSTLAAALTASKMGIRVAHVEAGLRSFDRTMPEEQNRVLTDHIADLLLTPSRDADANLINEGVSSEMVAFVGNVMIDTLVRLLPTASRLWPQLSKRFTGIRKGEYAVATLHRPSNVDRAETLRAILSDLTLLAESMPVIFPVHPRTRRRLAEIDGCEVGSIVFVEPVGYLEFLALQANARLVVTDSGGVQEETTFLGVPCITVRKNTERPITIAHGTNNLAPPSRLRQVLTTVLSGPTRYDGREIEFWDGHAAERVAYELVEASKAS